MRFKLDAEKKGWLWVDRGVDGRADHFKPCPVCGTALAMEDLEGRAWHEEQLCDQCETRAEIQGAISDAIDEERPLILDKKPERILPEIP